MSRRLQVIMRDDEIEELRRSAAREGLTLSEWARRALRRAQRLQRGPTAERKIEALERALTCDHPTGEIDEILASIETGRGLH